eukprot:422168_1
MCWNLIPVACAFTMIFFARLNAQPYQIAAEAFGGVAGVISNMGTTKDAIKAWFGEAVGIDIENNFAKVHISYEKPMYRSSGRKLGTIESAIAPKKSNGAIAFDDGKTAWGGVAFAARYSVQNLDKKKYCIDIVVANNGLYCQYKHAVNSPGSFVDNAGHYWDGYFVSVGTENCKISTKNVFNQVKTKVCNVIQKDRKKHGFVCRQTGFKCYWTKYKQGVGRGWALKSYGEPLNIQSRDKMISIRGDMSNAKRSLLKLEIGPYQWWRARKDKMFIYSIYILTGMLILGIITCSCLLGMMFGYVFGYGIGNKITVPKIMG